HLLVGRKRLAGWPAGADQLFDWSSQHSPDAAAGRTTGQAGGRGQDGRGRQARRRRQDAATADGGGGAGGHLPWPMPPTPFLHFVTAGLGINTPVDVEQSSDGPRLNLTGEEAELLVRHRGEPLKALQHVVDMAFGRRLPDDRRIFVDALSYRKGKDIELGQM